MSAYNARETCSCGAEFEMTGTFATQIDRSAEKWRQTHHHDRPAPSGEAAEPINGGA